MERNLEFYLGQQYAVLLRPLPEDEGGGWLAEIPELPGCMSDGETQEEALKNIEEAKKAWIRVALKRGVEIPLPRGSEEEFSGRLTLRMPKFFHRRLARTAEREGVSLNQFILNLLSYAYGALYGRPPRKPLVSWVSAFTVDDITIERTKMTPYFSLPEWRSQEPFRRGGREKLAEFFFP